MVNPEADQAAVIAGVKPPAKVLKQGVYDDIDLSLLHIDQSKLPPTLPVVQLCSAPPWPGDPVFVIDAGHATRSTIVAPNVLPRAYHQRFPTVIKDVATTGNSGSGVFDATKKMPPGSHEPKTQRGRQGHREIFRLADLIRAFMKGIELPKDNPKDTEQAH